jgi:hypothetical protein
MWVCAHLGFWLGFLERIRFAKAMPQQECDSRWKSRRDEHIMPIGQVYADCGGSPVLYSYSIARVAC